MVFNDNNISNKHDEHSFIKEISESGIMGVAKDYVGSLIMDAGKSMVMPMITSLIAWSWVAGGSMNWPAWPR